MITFQNASGLELIDANKESTAVGAYQARQANISILLAALNEKLALHSRWAANQPRDWGYVGDLGSVQGGLESIVAVFAS
ncbi:MAG: hypothetical protein K2X78_03105 [Burkholderiaceae bacterium]|nr:hypothetical protein [Burkholderiaceae bacterium]